MFHNSSNYGAVASRLSCIGEARITHSIHVLKDTEYNSNEGTFGADGFSLMDYSSRANESSKVASLRTFRCPLC